MDKVIKNKTFFSLVLLLVIVDQFFKVLFQNLLNFGESFDYGFFAFTLLKNTGSLFGLFQNTNLILLFITLIVIGVILFYYPKMDEKSKMPFALILSGGIGNVIDRIFLGGVIDFLNLKFWPVFNFADCFIVIGIIWLFVVEIRKKD